VVAQARGLRSICMPSVCILGLVQPGHGSSSTVITPSLLTLSTSANKRPISIADTAVTFAISCWSCTGCASSFNCSIHRQVSPRSMPRLMIMAGTQQPPGAGPQPRSLRQHFAAAVPSPATGFAASTNKCAPMFSNGFTRSSTVTLRRARNGRRAELCQIAMPCCGYGD